MSRGLQSGWQCLPQSEKPASFIKKESVVIKRSRTRSQHKAWHKEAEDIENKFLIKKESAIIKCPRTRSQHKQAEDLKKTKEEEMASAMDIDNEDIEVQVTSSSKGEKKRFEVKKV